MTGIFSEGCAMFEIAFLGVSPWAHVTIASKSLSFLITGAADVGRGNIDLSEIPKISP